MNPRQMQAKRLRGSDPTSDPTFLQISYDHGHEQNKYCNTQN